MRIYADGSADNMKKEAPSFIAVKPAGLNTAIVEVTATTNNEAEYMAAIAAVREAHVRFAGQDVEVMCDSMLVVKQAQLEWKCKEPRLAKLLKELLARVENCHATVSFVWVRREENPAGIELEKFVKRQRRGNG